MTNHVSRYQSGQDDTPGWSLEPGNDRILYTRGRDLLLSDWYADDDDDDPTYFKGQARNKCRITLQPESGINICRWVDPKTIRIQGGGVIRINWTVERSVRQSGNYSSGIGFSRYYLRGESLFHDQGLQDDDYGYTQGPHDMLPKLICGGNAIYTR